MKFNLLLPVFIFVSLGLPTFASEKYTYNDAAITNIISAGAQGGAVIALNKYTNFVTTQLIERPAVPTVLTDREIEIAIEKLQRSPLNTFGLGNAGGAVIDINYDVAQKARMIGTRNAKVVLRDYGSKPLDANNSGNVDAKLKMEIAKTEIPGGVSAEEIAFRNANQNAPQFAPDSWNLRKIGGLDNLKAQLMDLKSSGATVRSLSFRGFIPKMGGKVVGTLQVLLIGGALSNATNAAIYGNMTIKNMGNTWVSSRCNESAFVAASKSKCDEVGLVELYLDSAEYMFYRLLPD